MSQLMYPIINWALLFGTGRTFSLSDLEQILFFNFLEAWLDDKFLGFLAVFEFPSPGPLLEGVIDSGTTSDFETLSTFTFLLTFSSPFFLFWEI